MRISNTRLVSSIALVTTFALCGSQPTRADDSSNPYAPAHEHSYRHGAVPTRETTARMQAWEHAHSAQFAAPTATTGRLAFGGGVHGVGVNSGKSKVYLVFYGTQWGTQTLDANNNFKFSGDTSGAASAAQRMFRGIGTNGELWSAELTQWCDGPLVASGVTSCPAGANFIPYQANGVLAGVWYDNRAASPAAASGKQLAQEALDAAAHFGNTTAASNRYAYYVILSPHGTNPDNYKSPTQGYCAWHDWQGDGYGVTSTVGDVAFSNQPYNIDVGSSCGVNFVNAGAAGTLDGYTMTLGHEWHEMMSDQFPAGGWTNHTGGSYNGQENSDECAWIAPGQAGGAANIVFATGTFAEQASWSNDTGACAISHPIVAHSGGTTAKQLLGNTGFETGSATPWTVSAGVLDNSTGEPAHAGSWKAWMNGYGTTHTDTLAQSVAIPSGYTSATLKYYLHIDTAETATTTVHDKLTVALYSSSGALLKTLATWSNLNAAAGYSMHTDTLAAYIGQTVSIRFTGSEDASNQTSFVLDDVTLTVQ
jgi:serine protease